MTDDGRTIGCMWCDENSCDHGAFRIEPDEEDE